MLFIKNGKPHEENIKQNATCYLNALLLGPSRVLDGLKRCSSVELLSLRQKLFIHNIALINSMTCLIKAPSFHHMLCSFCDWTLRYMFYANTWTRSNRISLLRNVEISRSKNNQEKECWLLKKASSNIIRMEAKHKL